MAMTPKGKQSEAAIVLAAAHEFHAKGYFGASFSSIAERAGVQATHVQFHAQTKKRLAQLVVQSAFQSGVFLAQPRLPNDSPCDAILSFVSRVSFAFTQSPAARASVRLVSEITDGTFPKPYVGWIAQAEALVTEAVAIGELTSPVDVHELAVVLTAQFSGLKGVSEVLEETVEFPERATRASAMLLSAYGMDRPAERAEVALAALGNPDDARADL